MKYTILHNVYPAPKLLEAIEDRFGGHASFEEKAGPYGTVSWEPSNADSVVLFATGFMAGAEKSTK